jgi:peptide/nickel transport system permease protein
VISEAARDPLIEAEELRGQARSNQHFWIVRRLLLGVLTLFVVSVVVFAATQALPDDPARVILGQNATPENVRTLNQELGLDKPLVEQYTSWLGGVVTGDFGDSYAASAPVSELIGNRITNTLTLVLLVTIIAIPLSLLLGVLAASRRDGGFDRTVLLTSLALASLPEFVVGILLITLFATTVLTILPPVANIAPGEAPLAHLDHLVLPVVTLVVATVPYLFRHVRGSMIDVLESDYVQAARLHGLSERAVVLRHALPNGLVPAIQGTALALAYLTGGVVVIETLFEYPGLGSLLADSVQNRDMPVIQAVILIFATAYILFNLVADVLTMYLTPRLRTRTG